MLAYLSKMMFISEFQGDANFCFVSFTILVYPTINYFNKIDQFTIVTETDQIGSR